MRMGFGFVGLLVVVAIIAYMSSKQGETASRTNKAVKQEMTQVTGRGTDGVPMDKSAEFAAAPAGLSVSAVVAGGYFEQFYDLKKGDVVVEAGSSGSLKGVDENSATAFLFTAAQTKQPLTVLRAGQTVKLEPRTPKL